jgi:endonuclease YncB( thermonuclease family)
MRTLLTLFGVALALAEPTVAGSGFTAKVVAVHEGDRLTIYHDGRKEMILLKGIDCPELKQPYGKKAKQVTEAYVGTREVVIQTLHRDREGHIVAEIFLQDGRNVAQELVKEGLAWSLGKTAEGRSFDDDEQLARAARNGLWADPNPVPPWKWKAPKKTSRKFSN